MAQVGQGVRLPPFERLPVELRLSIWRQAREEDRGQRIVEITIENTTGQLVSHSPQPALLGVCSEARTELIPTYRRLPNAPGAPIIYVGLLEDVVFIREDKRGALTSQNHLLASILGSPMNTPVVTPSIITISTPITTTMWDLSGIRHFAVDFWVMYQAWSNLRALTSLRDLESFGIILVDREPQWSQPFNGNPTSYPRKTVDDLKWVGFDQRDVRQAVQHFWGITATTTLTWITPSVNHFNDTLNFVSQNVRHRMSVSVNRETRRLQRLDNNWIVPPRDLLTYGPYEDREDTEE